MLGGVIGPRWGRRTVVVGSLLVSIVPLVAVLTFQPGTLPYFAAVVLGGILLYTSSPVVVVAAQEHTPHAPAAAAGVVLGVSVAAAAAVYVALGWVQQLIGMTAGIAIGFAFVLPAAALGFAVLRVPTGPRRLATTPPR